MLQIIYISSAIPDFIPKEVDRILIGARRNNKINRITGLLLFDGVRFLQALEGDDALVEKTFARIVADSRHHAIVKLYERQIEHREFGEWEMASHNVHDGDQDATIATIDRLVADVPNANVREQFRSFSRIKR